MHHTIGNDTICISLAVFAEMDIETDCPDDEGNKDSGSIVYFLQEHHVEVYCRIMTYLS